MFNLTRGSAFALSLLLLISCGKEKSIETPGSNGVPVTTTGKLTMTIDGKGWVADRFAVASSGQGITAIYGQNNQGKSLVITLTGTATGEYILNQTNANAAAWTDSTETSPMAYTTNQGARPEDAGGRVIISSIDNQKSTISGTFQFNMFRELDNGRKTVVDGIFKDLPLNGSSTGGGTGNGGNTGGTGGNGGVNTGNSLTVTIDGTSYTPKVISGSLFQQIIIINGAEADGTKAVGFQIPASIVNGTYSLDPSSDIIALYNAAAFEPYVGVLGKLVITEHDKTAKRIKGTFEFTGQNPLTQATKKLTNGSFSINYN